MHLGKQQVTMPKPEGTSKLVRVDAHIRERLGALGDYEDSMNSIIRRLLDHYEKCQVTDHCPHCPEAYSSLGPDVTHLAQKR